ncbi:MAG: four helix bundle protein [Bacteroidetes bacterium]|nr:four helix bundle protein [Bacteroidota bacterium]
MKISQFEDIVAWQKAQDLAVAIHQQFGKSGDSGFKNQICRAAVSISNNIAEGFDRQTDKQFSSFLFIALGSNSEVQSMLHLAVRLNWISESVHHELIQQTKEISRIIFGFIQYLNKS